LAQDSKRRAEWTGYHLECCANGPKAAQAAAARLSRERIRRDDQKQLCAEGTGGADSLADSATGRFHLPDDALALLLNDQVRVNGGPANPYRLLRVNRRATFLSHLPQPASRNIVGEKIAAHIPSAARRWPRTRLAAMPKRWSMVCGGCPKAGASARRSWKPQLGQNALFAVSISTEQEGHVMVVFIRQDCCGWFRFS
jgi:hypothetical protein